MSGTLHDRLHHLADQVDRPAAAGGAGLHGPDLWQRGRRYQRLRRTGTAVISAAAVVLALVVAGVSWHEAGPQPAAAPADAPVALPDRIHEPSPWLPGTAETGPPGQLVVLIGTERGGWFGSSWGVVGVSATTGDYRFLDLPDAVLDGIEGEGASLSPDGRRVAYWLSGEPDGTPNTGWYHDTIVGVGVYDTTTGAVERHPIDTDHGLSADALAWVDEDTLAIEHNQILAGDDGRVMDQSSSTHTPTLRWDLGQGAPRVYEELADAYPSEWGPSVAGRVVVSLSGNRLVVVGRPLPGGRPDRIREDEDLRPWGALDPTGRRLAAIWTGDDVMPNRVAVADVPESPAERLTYEILPRSNETFRILGWVDADHIAVQRRSEPVREGLGMSIFSVHAGTGDTTELVELPEGSFSRGDWATDLLGAPVVERPAPPTPLSPRLTAGLLLAALVGGVLGIVGWRRRVQP